MEMYPGNWFENNPTKSIIMYTITILAVAYASLFFLLDENKTNLHQIEISNMRLEAEVLKERIELLEFENMSLRDENQRQKEWLQAIPGSVTYFDRRIKELEEARQMQTDEIPAHKPSKHSNYYMQSSILHAGQAYVDPHTGVAIGINDINNRSKANGTITYPDKPAQYFTNATAGKRWTFSYKKKNYELILTEVNAIGERYQVQVRGK